MAAMVDSKPLDRVEESIRKKTQKGKEIRSPQGFPRLTETAGTVLR